MAQPSCYAGLLQAEALVVPASVHMEFAVDRMPLEWALSRVFGFLLLVIPPTSQLISARDKPYKVMSGSIKKHNSFSKYDNCICCSIVTVLLYLEK